MNQYLLRPTTCLALCGRCISSALSREKIHLSAKLFALATYWALSPLMTRVGVRVVDIKLELTFSTIEQSLWDTKDRSPRPSQALKIPYKPHILQKFYQQESLRSSALSFLHLFFKFRPCFLLTPSLPEEENIPIPIIQKTYTHRHLTGLFSSLSCLKQFALG